MGSDYVGLVRITIRGIKNRVPLWVLELVPVAGLEPARCRHRWILSHTPFRCFLGIDMYLEVAGILYKARYFKHFWQQICKKVLFVCYSLPSFIKEHKTAVWRDIRGTFDLYI